MYTENKSCCWGQSTYGFCQGLLISSSRIKRGGKMIPEFLYIIVPSYGGDRSNAQSNFP